jgi:hypothetical protein
MVASQEAVLAPHSLYHLADIAQVVGGVGQQSYHTQQVLARQLVLFLQRLAQGFKLGAQ